METSKSHILSSIAARVNGRSKNSNDRRTLIRSYESSFASETGCSITANLDIEDRTVDQRIFVYRMNS